MIRYLNYLIVICMNINVNVSLKNNNGGAPTKLLISQLPFIIHSKTWYLIKVELCFFILVFDKQII